MARSKQAREVDGFSALRAAQRASGTQKPRPSMPPADASDATTPRIASHIRRTVMPTRYDLVCYACGFAFLQTGRSASTSCPKCRATLDLSDHQIEGLHTADLRTAGKVHLKPGATVEKATIEAGEMILEGTVLSGRMTATRRLEVRSGAAFPEETVCSPHWVIGAHVALRRDAPLNCRVLELHGLLRGAVEAYERVVIHAGGCLEGTLAAPGLVVAEGGGLRARVSVRAERSPS